MPSMEYIYSFTVALFLTIAMIPLLIRFSEKLQLVDDPGAERKMHDRVMPRSGGIAIIAGVFVPLAFSLALDHYLTSLFVGCAIIIVFGLLDDKKELNYKWKLFGQSLAAFVVMSGGIIIHRVPFLGLDDVPLWLSCPLTYFFLLGVVNGVNFSDGLDGLAAGASLLALATIAILAAITENHSAVLIALTVIGGILGFLRFNTHPAQIFMGDAGSQFLGFITACLAILITQAETSALSPFLPVILLGLPIMDIVQVIPVRIKKKLPLPGPDKEHVHHQLVKLSFRHHEVVAIIYILQVGMMAGAYFLKFASDLSLLMFYLGYLAVVLGTLLIAHTRGWRVRDEQAELDFTRKDRRNKLLRRMWWIHEYAGMAVLILMMGFYVVIPFLLDDVNLQFSVVALVLAALFGASFLLFRAKSMIVARLSCYSASVFQVYLIADQLKDSVFLSFIDGFLVVLAIVLALAIRTTRKEQFRLDTQDLLILLMVLIVPQLPFNTLDKFAVGSIALRLAVLMYGCEFLLARGNRENHRCLSIGSAIGLIGIGLVGL